MANGTSPVPEGRPALAAAIAVPDAAAAIAFYVAAFGAVEEFRLTEPSGRVGHAELRIGGTLLMLSDPHPEYGVMPPGEGDRAMRLHLYVEDVDATIARAVAAGARVERPATDQFYGDRSGMIVDPAGHAWNLASRREALSLAEIQARWDEMMKG